MEVHGSEVAVISTAIGLMMSSTEQTRITSLLQVWLVIQKNCA